jgi:uncharacterized YigZ family protein
MDEFTEKKSRFMGRVWYCGSEREALGHIELVKKEKTATHHAYAYSVKGENVIRFSDDGEPGGTAGMPILEVFRREGIDDFVCTVTRWYGGIQLGAGGLTRAYAKGAKIALDSAGTAELKPFCTLTLTAGYHLFERIKLAAEESGGEIEEAVYQAEIDVRIGMLKERTDGFIARIVEMSAGGVSPRIDGEKLIPVKIK